MRERRPCSPDRCREIYPHCADLSGLPFWKCDTFRNYVGCHHETADRTKPLGNIPTREIMNARKHIHALFDPIWKQKRMPRGKIYAIISERIGKQYHTGEIASLEEARRVYRIAKELAA